MPGLRPARIPGRLVLKSCRAGRVQPSHTTITLDDQQPGAAKGYIFFHSQIGQGQCGAVGMSVPVSAVAAGGRTLLLLPAGLLAAVLELGTIITNSSESQGGGGTCS